jgi:DNA (cytosine-5)-methyltransferase 1
VKPVILDAYCGAGGVTRGLEEAGFEVVGVDIADQPNYCGAEFVQADALEFLGRVIEDEGICLGRKLVGIHASPPCQAHSTLKAVTQHIDHPELVGPTRLLLERTGLYYIIENVPGAPLVEPTMLCGSAFGLDVRRHRMFETNFPLMSPGCAHGAQAKRFDVFEHGEWRKSPTVPVYGVGGGKAKEHWAEAMGIDWMTHDEMAQAIPPAFTRHIGEALLTHIEANRVAA